MSVVVEAHLPNLCHRGKVRDTCDLGQYFLMVATDRLSAFDVVLPDGIPDKGAVLNQLSAFWFQKTVHIVPNHLVEAVEDVRILEGHCPMGVCYVFPSYLGGRSMLVRKAQRIDVECVVRGYLAGSAWEEYKKAGTVCGAALPPGMVESQQLPEPIFTPASKEESGHDINISIDQMKKLVGGAMTDEIVEKSLAIYRFADDYARPRGIIIADTKMEFGFIDGKVSLIDELLTPDSSRFWDAELYRPGQSQPSYDKQPVRDWLVASGWNKEPPAPKLPPEVVQQTTARYREAFRRLTGNDPQT
ncbi:MAG: phosphoribosylaminoimidazolesuccinocarboxamide synthase [Chloroflexi bacterium]|nr:phosphoribosylaminoimidazolesuccinocarboxamide synthase [Chloroflexota bacterium]